MGSMAGVYKPAEDTLLLLRHAERLVEGDVLEMGTGSGYIAIELSHIPRVRRVVGVDIDPDAVKFARNNALEAGVSDNVSFSESDLFKSLGDSRFDWILFNPPYLPSEGAIDELSWGGGSCSRSFYARLHPTSHPVGASLRLSPPRRISSSRQLNSSIK
jgi:HemK-related putative methylase